MEPMGITDYLGNWSPRVSVYLTARPARATEPNPKIEHLLNTASKDSAIVVEKFWGTGSGFRVKL